MLLGPDGYPAKHYSTYGSYVGASRSRRTLRDWNPIESDADSATIYDLPTLRARSYDLYRNNPLATSAIKTLVTHSIGTGLQYQSRIDREYLGMSDDQADAWEENAEREFKLATDTKEFDIAEEMTFTESQDLFLRSRLLGGDVFSLFLMAQHRGSAYKIRTQMIEAQRVCNKAHAADSDTLVGGIERDARGRAVNVHIANRSHYGLLGSDENNWRVVPVYGARTGKRNVLHGILRDRPGQARGVPFLSSVIEKLKQIDRYTDAELMASVVSSKLTVFIEQSLDAPLGPTTETEEGIQETKLGDGAVIGLAPGEHANGFNPLRPNAQFAPFVDALAKWIGASLEIPSELLLKHFMASYSASRAALMMAWKFFLQQRFWTVSNYCNPVLERTLMESVALGRIHAPGFMTDPLLRQAYCGAVWIGPAKGQIDELKEGQAAELYNKMTVKTLDEITAEVSGGDWDMNLRQIQKERKRKAAAGIQNEMKQPTQTEPNEPEDQEEEEGSEVEVET